MEEKYTGKENVENGHDYAFANASVYLFWVPRSPHYVMVLPIPSYKGKL